MGDVPWSDNHVQTRQTSSKWLCIPEGSPVTTRPLQDHLHQSTDKVSTCRLQKCMWPESTCKNTTKDVTQHTTEVLCYREHFSGIYRDEQSRKTDAYETWLSNSTPSVNVRLWTPYFEEKVNTSVFLSCQEQVFRDTTDERGRSSVCPLTTLGHVSLRKVTPLYFLQVFTFFSGKKTVSHFGVSIPNIE